MANRDASGDDVRVAARNIRPAFRDIRASLATYVGVAWLVAFPLMTWGTAWGAAERDRIGPWGWFISWLVLTALAVVGSLAAYRMLLGVSQGAVAYSERRVVRLALGDAFISMGGAFLLLALPITFMADVLFAAAFVAVIGLLFSAALLVPVYIKNWRDARSGGHIIVER